MSELEIKLHVEAGRRDHLLDALGRRRIRKATLSAIYFDTPDLLLARRRFALRLRKEDGHWVQTLKGPGRGRGAERLEDEVAVAADGTPERGDAAVPALDLDRHAHSTVGRRLRALLRRAKRPALAEVCRTEVTRSRRLLNAHGAAVEWALDEGELTAAGRTRPISELELEFKRGDPAGLYASAHDWAALHGLWIDPVSKSERGGLLFEDEAFNAPVKAVSAPWDGKEATTLDGDAMLRRMVSACLAQILPNAGELARGSEDAEHVHQLRVGLRRLRSVAWGMKPFAAGLPDGWEDAVMPVFAALGQARDRHVRATSIAPALRRAGAPVDGFAPASEAEAKALRQLVRGAGFQGMLMRLMAFAHEVGPDADRAGDGSGLAHLARQLRKLARQVNGDARRFDELPFAGQHRVRKRLKRLRYLAEFAAPAFDRRAVKAWFDRVSPAQDDLGSYVDAALAAKRFEALAASDPGAWFAVGWLRARGKTAARAGRKSLERLRRATAFWAG